MLSTRSTFLRNEVYTTGRCRESRPVDGICGQEGRRAFIDYGGRSSVNETGILTIAADIKWIPYVEHV